MMEYKVFEHPNGKIEVVKQGWLWPAFFFTLIWTLVKRLWIWAVIIFGVMFILRIICVFAGGTTEAINGLQVIANLIIMVVFGVNGYKLRESNLLSRGFEFKTTVTASNQDGAIALYLKEKHKEGHESYSEKK